MTRLAYEGAADLYDHALHALDEIDDELPDRDDQIADLLVARCEALLAAGDVTSAAGAVSQLQQATVDSARLSAWATCFDGQLSVLVHPERLDDVEPALGAAAQKLAEIDDAAGEAKAHTVRATCLARLGRIGDCEIALDDALTAARRVRDHRRVNAVLAGAPLAALWGPNPVPRAGGRCLDVVRLLRITTDSPAVEATSTRCQAVLEAFRGRDAAARRMIDSARRTVTELGLRHALLEVEQFAGIVELVLSDPAAAEPHLRQACNGFRRMGLDADTAETAALLGRACLALNRDPEADELCTESERLAGHALKASIAWRTLRAQLLSRSGEHDEARRVAQAAITLAERTDGLVDHGDACLSLARVLRAAGDDAGARAAAERAANLYERKGAAALTDKARSMLDERVEAIDPTPPAVPVVETRTAAVQASERAMAAIAREAWDEFERMFAPAGSVESRRKIVGFKPTEFRSDEVIHQTRRDLETGIMRLNQVVIAVRGERLALARMTLGTLDMSPGAPQDEFLMLYGIDEEGRIALQIWFDLEDMDAALAELDAVHAQFEEERLQARRLENAASRLYERFKVCYAARDWSTVSEMLADDVLSEDRRHPINSGVRQGRDALIAEISALAEVGIDLTTEVVATRGERLVLSRIRTAGRDQGPDGFGSVDLDVLELGVDGRFVARIVFDVDDFDAAIAELDARYLAGEAAAYGRTWSAISASYAAINRHELPLTTPDCVNIDRRRETAMGVGDLIAYIGAGPGRDQDNKAYVEAVHRLTDPGAVVTYAAYETSQEGFDAEWRGIAVLTVEGDMVSRTEVFDEMDLDAAITRFDQLSRPAPRFENAAHQTADRFLAYFAVGDWDAMAEILADNLFNDDRRRVVNAGVFDGRDAQMANTRVIAELWSANVPRSVVATRGRNLFLGRITLSGDDEGVEAFLAEMLVVVEIDADELISAIVLFDLDDIDAAVAELDARYVAGEAAAHSETWLVIAEVYAAVNRREIPVTAPDLVDIDHRSLAAIGSGDLKAYLQAAWKDSLRQGVYIETVHRLTDLGAVITHVAKATSREGFDAEWRITSLLTVGGDLMNRYEIFDAADLEAALARFDELHRQPPRFENTAAQAYERIQAHFAARDWDAVAEALADGAFHDDRRRAVGAGLRRGRDAVVAEFSALAEIGVKRITFDIVATRGSRLVLTRSSASGRDPRADSFRTDVLRIAEVDANERTMALITFDPDDFDAAIAELDARYLAGEAAVHSGTWSLVARTYAAANMRQLQMTPDCVSIDHRRTRAFAPGGLTAYMRATWDLAPDVKAYIEAVHRLNDLGAVVTHVVRGTSQEGFDAEWREVILLTFEGDLVNRGEIFDEADLDAALASFEELRPRTPPLENAASRVDKRFQACFAARDWDVMAKGLSDGFSIEDRRRVVNMGNAHGRDAELTVHAYATVGTENVKSTVIATRAQRLALNHYRFSGRDQRPDAFRVEMLAVVEIDADERMAAVVVFDADDIDAAFEELDARYLAGEAAAHARTWSVIARGNAAANRNAKLPMTQDSSMIDHRLRTTLNADRITACVRATWDLTPELHMFIESVHQLNDVGTVVTHASRGTSQDDFEGEWRQITLFTVDGDLCNRCEIFDEDDLGTALARFTELQTQARRVENAASQVAERFLGHFAVSDWHAMAEILADNFFNDDRRPLVSFGVLHGRDAQMANMRAVAELLSTDVTSTVIATRAARLALVRLGFSVRGQGPDAFQIEVLGVVGIDIEDRIAAFVVFDLDDIDAAFAELDARYLAGEAAAHAQMWSLVVAAYAAFDRHELPAADWVTIDHRRATPFASSTMTESLRAIWDLTPALKIYIEAVHRLNSFGAVITHEGHGSSQEGFDAEWRAIDLLTVEGDRITACEIFDEADLDAALTRFEELHPQTRRLENRVQQRFLAHFAARDWDAVGQDFADDYYCDDRRRVVNAGVRHGRDAAIEDLRVASDIGLATNITSDIIATRGERLILTRFGVSSRDHSATQDVLQVVEHNAEEQIAAAVVFDVDDLDAAFEELDARYLAGEAAPHAHIWTAIAKFHRRRRTL